MRSFLKALQVLWSVALIGDLLSAASFPGSGSPNLQVQVSFNAAYTRGTFASLVNQPTADIRSLGTPGIVQEFTSKAAPSVKYALIMPDPTLTFDLLQTWQVWGDIYTYYNVTGLGVGVVGYPTMDTTACPVNSFGVCTFQLFSKNIGLFVYSAPSVIAGNYEMKDPYFTQFVNGGGITTFGPVTGAASTATSLSGIIANQLPFASGVVYSYPSTATAPSNFGISGAFYSAFAGSGGIATLGLPTSNVLSLANGLSRQTFEYGRIELPSGATVPNVIFSIAQVAIVGFQQGITLTPGSTATLNAAAVDSTGTQVSGRALTWSSSNGAVAVVQGLGDSATVRAISGGTANIYVSGEGKTSQPFVVKVPSVCCAVGEGAPTATISQAFQAAVTRNNLLIALPAPSPVTRKGSGYTQVVQSPDGLTTYVLAEADNTSVAWLLTGDLYTAYLANGGFTGSLGYPASDPLPGGVQKFQSGSFLAGSPAQVIPASVAVKWQQLGGIAGAAAAPLNPAAVFQAASGNKGAVQNFANGSIFAITSGPLAGKAYFSSGPILARYLALSGPAGPLGAPISDISGAAGVLTQSFETGYIDLQAGAAAAVEHYNPRTPAISITPASVIPGGRVHISASGFAPAATLSFAVTGQAPFSVQVPAGGFQWDIVVPASAKPGVVSVQASAQPGSDAASSTYAIVQPAALLPHLTITSGNNQTAAPGSLLARPITAVLLDSQGNPIAGVPVTVTASPGAMVQSSGTTDAAGSISLSFRLPPATGVAVGSMSAAGQTVTFSALAAASSLSSFPAFPGDTQQSALLSSLAGVIRYYQNQGALPSPNGLATPTLLNTFLMGAGGFQNSDSGVSIANPWVAGRFAKAGIFPEAPTADRLRDLLSAGTPAVICLSITADGAPAGMSFVSATGINSDGSLSISDPSAVFARTSLSDYLSGFAANGHLYQGAIAAVLRVGLDSTPAGALPFVMGAPLSASSLLASPLGSCSALDLNDPAPAANPAGVRYQYCDGTQPSYEADFTNNKGATLFDIGGGTPVPIPVASATSWRVTRGQALVAAPQALSVASVVDSAAFATQLSPGALISIFGAGFSGTPTVTLGSGGSTPLKIVASFPYQINAALPAALPVGASTLTVTAASGSATTPISISPIGPGIFVLGLDSAGMPLGATLNQDGSINGPDHPAQRGQFISIYCTGLGATTLKAGLQTVNAPVSVVLNGVTVNPSFAGLVAGFVGLYQVNVTVPANLPPGLSGTMLLKSGSATGNTVRFALQ